MIPALFQSNNQFTRKLYQRPVSAQAKKLTARTADASARARSLS
jgi:hypothetical protein